MDIAGSSSSHIPINPVSPKRRASSDSGYHTLCEAHTTIELSDASAEANLSQSYDSRVNKGKAIDNQENEPVNGGESASGDSSKRLNSFLRAYLLRQETSPFSNPCLKTISKASSALPQLFGASINNQKNKFRDSSAFERLDHRLFVSSYGLGVFEKEVKFAEASLKNLLHDHEIEDIQLKLRTNLFQIENEVLQAANKQARLTGPTQNLKAAQQKLNRAQVEAEAEKSELQALESTLPSLEVELNLATSMFDIATKNLIKKLLALREARLANPLELDFDAALQTSNNAHRPNPLEVAAKESDFKAASGAFDRIAARFTVASQKLGDTKSKIQEAQSKLQALKLPLITAALELRTEALKLQQAVYKLEAPEPNNADSELESAIMESEVETMQFQLIEAEVVDDKSVDPEYFTVLEEKLKSAEKEVKKAESSARLLLETHAQSFKQNINEYLKIQQELIREYNHQIIFTTETSKYYGIHQEWETDSRQLKKNIKEKKYEGKDEAYYQNQQKSNIEKIDSLTSSCEQRMLKEKSDAQKTVEKKREALQKISEAFKFSFCQRLIMFLRGSSPIPRFSFQQSVFTRPIKPNLIRHA